MHAKPRAMRDALLEQIHREMASDSSIFFVSADFGSPVLDRIRADHPTKFVNVGIAEQNLINVSAGLALEGYKVFAYAIAPFITMRCFEQIRVSLALLSEVRPMNVNLIGVGAGYSYVVSGPTHQCYEDITLMRALPNFQVMSPADHITAELLFGRCVGELGPKYLRLDAQVLPAIYTDAAPNIADGFHVHRQEGAICMIATGYMLHTAVTVAERLQANGVRIGLIDLFDLARFSTEKLREELSRYETVVSMEEGFAGRGGLDALLYNFISHNAIDVKLLNIGVEGSYRFELGTRAELHEQVGIGPEVVTRRILDLFKSSQGTFKTIKGDRS
ncbi:MAG: transketolase [Acidobacteria bacterium]|nr:transketolase [Acidobacteriota bacterium]MBV9481101.1 transketolase [Acidobacteriota bacterium]